MFFPAFSVSDADGEADAAAEAGTQGEMFRLPGPSVRGLLCQLLNANGWLLGDVRWWR